MKKRTLFKSLEAKITWQMMLISLLPIIIIGSFAYYTADQSVQATKESLQDSHSTLEKNVVSTNIVSTAQRTIADIDQLMIDLIEQSIVWTSYPGILQTVSYNGYRFETLGLHEMPKEQAEITVAENPYLNSHSVLDDYLSKQLAFEEHTKQILVTDSHGLRAASTGISSDFVLSDELWWKTAWQEGFYIGISKYVDSHEFWGVDIAVRIENPQTGESLGVFKTVLDIAAIQELATHNANLIQSGNISVFTSDGLLLAETSSLHQAKRIMTPDIGLSASTETSVNLAILSDSASGYNLTNDTVAGFARSAQADYYESINGFDGFGWGVIVEQPQEIAFASLNSLGALKDDLNSSRRELSIAIIGIAVAMILVALFIAIRQSRKITGPISRLRDAAERVRVGDDEVEIAVETDDEIGDLAVAFGRMFFERRQAMEILRDNEERFRTIFEHSNDHIIYIDKSGIIVDTNSKVEELYGYTPEEIIGKKFTDLGNIVPQYLPKMTGYFEGMVDGNKPDGLTEVEIIHKYGRVIIAEANVSAVRIDGEVEGMLAIVRDVTERKRTEEALQENEKKFRTIFEHAYDEIIYLDELGTIIDVNNRIKDIWGYEREEVIGKNFMDFPFVLPESMDEIAEKFTQALTENQTSVMTEIKAQRKDGSILSAELNARVIEVGERKAILATVRDITERKQAEEFRETLLAEKNEHNKYLKETNLQLERAYDTLEWEKAEREKLNEELEDKNSELEQVIYVTSHDLRSPMVNIGGFGRELEMSTADLKKILQDEQVPPQIRDKILSIVNIDIAESLDFIQSSVLKMDNLLNGLLQVSRAGRMTPNFEELDMNGLMYEVRNSFEHVIRERGIKLNITDLPSCIGDQDQLNQVFSNLLGNALKYLDPNRAGIINISGFRDEDQVAYCFEDNGIGIPEEHKEKVFQMFHRINLEVASGDGLGLTIIRKILNKHHGKIWLESEYGVGSKFFIALPDTANVKYVNKAYSDKK